MPDLSSIKEKLGEQLVKVGLAGLTALFPRDFEYYLVTLELVTFEGDTIDYFIFPVNPNSMTKSELERTSIRKTLRGTTIISSDSFVPKDLTIQGNFGRSLKIITPDIFGGSLFKAVKYSIKNGVYSSEDIGATISDKKTNFNPLVKTGFGALKILQSIIDKAKSNENGKAFRLYFYNPALGESYLVVPTKNPLQINQDVNSSNMIWNYTLNLKVIGDLSKLEFQGSKPRSSVSILAAGAIQKAVNSVGKEALNFI